MAHGRERLLISFIVISVFGVVQLHFIMSHPRHRHGNPSPCPSAPGIHWVRDPTSCSKYFICVASQPVRMPACPPRTVWSEAAKNCVPANSLWNDCPKSQLEHMRPAPSPSPKPTPYSAEKARNWTASSDRMDALVDPLSPEKEQRERLLRLLPNHPCVFSDNEAYLPHPNKCHWFYNCSARLQESDKPGADPEGWDALTAECPYPQLFSLATRSCEDYAKVDCGKRGLFLDPCEYREHQCLGAHCQPCHLRQGSCVGMRDGLQPFPGREWTPRHLVCKNQRTVEQLDCPQDKPIFSPDMKRCESLLDIPKMHGGFQPSCVGRLDGRYPGETDRCDVFYECADEEVQGRFQCPQGTVYNPERQACRMKNDRAGLVPPCGNNSTKLRVSLALSLSMCRGLPDGMYADTYGRCPFYYQCQHSLLKRFHKCHFGTFDPSSQDCQFDVSRVPAPCGHRPNPCINRDDGQYADLSQHCQASFHCRRRLVAREQSCPPGTVFHEGRGSCQLPNDTPAPCGLAPSCTGRADGRYPSSVKGCQFYFTCRAGVFRGYGRCSVEDGGFYFNPESQSCDFPQNICSPCGVRTTNCSRSTKTIILGAKTAQRSWNNFCTNTCKCRNSAGFLPSLCRNTRKTSSVMRCITSHIANERRDDMPCARLCCGKIQASQNGLDDIDKLSGSQRYEKGQRKCKWRSDQTAPGCRPSVYYVKGSRVPVETLGSDTGRDSRFLGLDRHRQDNAALSRPTAGRMNTESAELAMGNPTLLFLLNWQTIPPFTRLAVIQRAAHAGNTSMLPIIREVGQEVGDSSRRGRRAEVAFRDGNLPGMTSGGEGEGQAARDGLFRQVAATGTSVDIPRVHGRDRHTSPHAVASDGIRTRLEDPARRCRSEC
ncbi:hypothetical protein BaRGS_00011911 [Batillaria attramentaria]|uniref:Chitin-binding type-2 domain-containing protein n=1 Tax=Batillaria attramentaria TaxID=370345 RepID=A0ABD0LBH5_9CAEN